MSIPHAILAMLSSAPRRASQVRADFESCTGGTWPLNMGQVATTLDRLVRDGLVAAQGDGAEAPQTYAITAAGHQALHSWWASPVQRDVPSRDELTIKLAMAVAVPAVDIATVVQRQRTETQRALQTLTRLKRGEQLKGDASELAWSLVLEKLIFAAEAELRWMEHVEERLNGRERAIGSGIAASTHGSAPVPTVAVDA